MPRTLNLQQIDTKKKKSLDAQVCLLVGFTLNIMHISIIGVYSCLALSINKSIFFFFFVQIQGTEGDEGKRKISVRGLMLCACVLCPTKDPENVWRWERGVRGMRAQ